MAIENTNRKWVSINVDDATGPIDGVPVPEDLNVVPETTPEVASADLKPSDIPKLPTVNTNLRSTAFGPRNIDPQTAYDVTTKHWKDIGGNEFQGSSGMYYRGLDDPLPTVATQAYPPNTIIRVYSDIYPNGKDFQVAGTGPADPLAIDFFTTTKEDYAKMADQKLSAVSIIDSTGAEISITQNDSLPNPNPQAGARRGDVTLGGAGSARGHFSIPDTNAKVWVFFHDGDTQRPVYFASCPSGAEIAAALQSKSLFTEQGDYKLENGKESQIRTDALAAAGGGVKIQSNFEKNKGELSANLSNINIQSGASNILVAPEGVHIYSRGSLTQEMFSFVQNTDEEHIYCGGLSHSNYVGGKTILVGNHTTEGVKAANNIQNNVNAVHEKESEAIKSTGASTTECPICAQKYLVDKTTFVKKIVDFVKKIANMLPWNCWNWPVTQFLMNMVVVPFLSEVSGLVASGGKGCGACKDGQIDSAQSKVEAGNQAAADELKNRQSAIDENSKKLPESPYIVNNTHDIYLKAGLARNNAKAFNDTGCKVPIPIGTKKSEKEPVSHQHCGDSPCTTVAAGAVTKTFGNITLDAANDIKLVAGSPGIDIMTQGMCKVAGGGVEVTASDGPANISSNNVTTVSGKTVVIQDKDNGGISLQSKNIMAGGAHHVTGDSYTAGTSTSDAIATKHLIMPSMRSETTMSSSAKSVTDGATWYLEGSIRSTIQDMVRNGVFRNPKGGFITSPSGLTTIIQEMYNMILGAIPIHAQEIGFCLTWPMGYTRVYGYRHTHSITAQDHNHQMTLPKGNYYNDTEAWHQARPETSSVPTPAPGQGDGQSPGPKSLGACGGGGFGFGDSNSSASQNRKKRNASVGLADGDYNYSRIVIDGTGWVYDPDGNIVPTPDTGLTADC